MTVRKIGIVECEVIADLSAPWSYVYLMEADISRMYGGKGHPALDYPQR